MDLSALFPAFFQALEPGMLGMVLLGTILGIVVGSLPGLTSTMGVALLVPFTFSMSPAMGLALLGAIYASSSYAGSISAILLNIPGTPSNCCTLLDGYPMTQKGQASRALALSTIGSAVGGILSVFALLFLAPPLARLALEFGSQEYFIMALFGVAIIAALSEKNIVKGMITGIFGLLLSIVGMHPITGEARFTFDLPELFNGLSLVTALIGLYSLPEVVSMLRDEKDAVKVESSVSCSGIIRAMREILKYKMLTLRASIIGIIIGIVPGAGQSIASFIAYDDAKKSAKDPSHFGTGCPEGVLASEVSNNAVVGGSLVPAFTLGIPGNAVSAVLISGLMIHGLQPGPTLFQENAETVYSFIFSLLIANVAFIPIGILCAKYCVKLLAMPKPILASLVLALAVIGSYAVNGSIVEVWVMIGFGALGCAMKHFNLPREPLVLGLVLGTMAESELARALALVQGDVSQLLLGIFSSPICMILIGLILYSIIRSQYKKRKASAKPSDQKTELSEEARITAAS
ncbi:tripartite tricarboxylate transporter permease [Parasutterella excrementihominis]|uniref:tripartite tricarboxylate transporter permease n=1 Tax=Parasutterella excrementihominis TaxID=487175 RepID=UPI0026654F7E|nr:tripartite tricarboxylate transporter permease [Parasutterella excrementihominis]